MRKPRLWQGAQSCSDATMIPYKPIPNIDLGFIQLHWYGIFAALGFLAAILLAERYARKQGVPENTVQSLGMWLIVGGLAGARLSYVLFYWPSDFQLTFFAALKFWEGGLAWFGGFIGAVISGFLYLKKHSLDFWQYADLFTIPLVVGHVFGRIGDYVIGGHPGKVTTLPWAIWMDGAARHPVVLYEITGLIIILGFCLYARRWKLPEGVLFLVYTSLYAVQRFFLDFFRIESTDPRTFGLTPSQLLVIVIFATAISIMLTKYAANRTATVQGWR